MPIPNSLKRALDAPAAWVMSAWLQRLSLGDGPRHHVFEATLEAIYGMNRGLKADIVQFDPKLMWALKPHSALGEERVCERGMMNGPFAMAGHPEAKPVRVLILGTSNFIMGSPNLFRRLRDRVEAAHPDAQLINASVPGYTSLQLLHYFARLIPLYRPTHVLACSVWPDCWPRHLLDDLVSIRVLASEPWRGGPLAERMGRALMYARWRLRHDGPRVPLRQYRQNWRWLAAYARKHACRPAFFHYPVFFEIPPLRRFLRMHGAPWLPERYAKYREAFLEIGRRHSLCDCSGVLSDEPGRYYENDGQHLNNEGLERVVASLADYVVKDLIG